MYIYGMRKVKQYSIAEGRSVFATLVKEAEAGFEVKLARRGKPVAVLVSLGAWERLQGDRQPFARVYRDFLSRHSLDEAGLEEGFVRSLRMRDAGREVAL
jgi:prevent-host-death family protein